MNNIFTLPKDMEWPEVTPGRNSVFNLDLSAEEASVIKALEQYPKLDVSEAGCLLRQIFQEDMSPALLEAVLSRSPRLEYKACCEYTTSGPQEGAWIVDTYTPYIRLPDFIEEGFWVTGTLVVIAAVLGKTEHLQRLIQWGMDENAGAPCMEHEYTSAMFGKSELRLGTRWAMNGCSVELHLPGHMPERVENATPLCTAILFGRMDCVRLLLDRPGVWTWENPSVHSAIAIAWGHEDPAVREAGKLVYEHIRETGHRLDLHAVAEYLSPKTLEELLTIDDYTTGELRVFAAQLVPECGHGFRELSLIKILMDRDPAVLDTPELMSALACSVLAWPYDEDAAVLAECVCHGTLDLGFNARWADRSSAREQGKFMKRLRKRCELVMKREAFAEAFNLNLSRLRNLYRYIRLLPSAEPEELSALTCLILASTKKDLKMLEFAIEKDMIPEPLEDMLLYLKRIDAPTAARGMLLAARGEEQKTAPTAVGEPWEAPDVNDFLDFGFCCTAETPAGSADCDSALIRLCLEGRTEQVIPEVKNWIDQGAMPAERVLLHSNDHDYLLHSFALTPLCAAAMAGRTETAKALLAMGLDPEERDAGTPGRYNSGFCAEYAVTPLALAILFGKPDTAELLIAYGARCDMNSNWFRSLRREIIGGKLDRDSDEW